MMVKRRVRSFLERIPGAVNAARLALETFRVSYDYRVTGLAGEAAFFMILSLPPLVLGLFGGLGYLGIWLDAGDLERIVATIQEYAARFLTRESIDDLLLPTIRDVLAGGRPELVSFGFLLSIWSGSRALNVFLDTISIMYGQKDARGYVRLRALSILIYLIGMVAAIVLLPLVLLGPVLVRGWLPDRAEFLAALYWPTVVVLSLAALTTLYHMSTPRRGPWKRNIPGACLALGIWLLASFFVRAALEFSLGGTTIYGPLSTPIVLLIWLFTLAIAILIGAGLNAATRVVWPVTLHDGWGTRLASWAGGLINRPDSAEPGERHTPVGDVVGGGVDGQAGVSHEVAVGTDDELTPEEVEQARRQQFVRRERSAVSEAIRRELDEGIGHPKDDARR